MNHQPSAPWPVVLTIAGFDPSAGAGAAADLKTFAAHSCYGVAALTALTVQNTQGVRSLLPVEPCVLREAVMALLADGGVRAVKVGMLANQANAGVVREILDANASLPVVLDPVYRSTSGTELIDAAGFAVVREHLLRRSNIVTPNLEEAAALTGLKVENIEGMRAAARRLIEMGARVVVITGGHLDKPVDVFFDGVELESFASDHIKPDNIHGAGCTFSSAVAASLALGRQPREAVMLAKAYVAEAIRKAYGIGPGRLPLNHLYRLQQSPRIVDHSPPVPEPVH